MGKRSLIAYGMFLLLPVGASAQNSGRSGTLFADYSFETGWPVSTIQTMNVSRLTLELAFPLSSGDAWHLEYPVSLFLALARNNPGSVPVVQRWEFADLGPPPTSHGVGVHPLGLRVVRTTGRVAIYTQGCRPESSSSTSPPPDRTHAGKISRATLSLVRVSP